MGITSAHLVEFHPLLPSFDHGMHFWPSGQFCSQRSHSNTGTPDVLPPQSRNEHIAVVPVVPVVLVVLVVLVVVGSVAAAEVVPAESVPFPVVVALTSPVAPVECGLGRQLRGSMKASRASRIADVSG